MELKSILFYNFRNFSYESLDIRPGMNLIYGENGAGKTTFLEGLYLALTGTVFKDTYYDLVKRDQTQAGVRAKFKEGVRDMEKIVYIKKDNGVLREINDKRVGRIRNFKTHNAVVFEPYDTFIIDGSPGLRRRFLDDMIQDVSLSYEKNLRDFNNLYRLRNEYLQTANPKFHLDLMDDDYIKLCQAINHDRIKYMELLEKRTARHLYDIDPNWKVKFSIDYSWDRENPGAFRDQALAEDLRRRYSTWGVHKDDIVIEFNGQLAKSSASRGQKRAIVVSMKLANLDILKRLSNRESIILLDDLLYEFDSIRNANLENKIKGMTAFVTSTSLMDADAIIEIKDNKMKYL
uniref:DNA replication/repair protein RecF n=1 Tax=Ezakiella massiliensis TaxID=1852374 RepID=UPI00094E4B9C|nr:DNA replication and repair protein RecF [Ezakiella massiliensis]